MLPSAMFGPKTHRLSTSWAEHLPQIQWALVWQSAKTPMHLLCFSSVSCCAGMLPQLFGRSAGEAVCHNQELCSKSPSCCRCKKVLLKLFSSGTTVTVKQLLPPAYSWDIGRKSMGLFCGRCLKKSDTLGGFLTWYMMHHDAQKWCFFMSGGHKETAHPKARSTQADPSNESWGETWGAPLDPYSPTEVWAKTWLLNNMFHSRSLLVFSSQILSQTTHIFCKLRVIRPPGCWLLWLCEAALIRGLGPKAADRVRRPFFNPAFHRRS